MYNIHPLPNLKEFCYGTSRRGVTSLKIMAVTLAVLLFANQLFAGSENFSKDTVRQGTLFNDSLERAREEANREAAKLVKDPRLKAAIQSDLAAAASLGSSKKSEGPGILDENYLIPSNLAEWDEEIQRNDMWHSDEASGSSPIEIFAIDFSKPYDEEIVFNPAIDARERKQLLDRSSPWRLRSRVDAIAGVKKTLEGRFPGMFSNLIISFTAHSDVYARLVEDSRGTVLQIDYSALFKPLSFLAAVNETVYARYAGKYAASANNKAEFKNAVKIYSMLQALIDLMDNEPENRKWLLKGLKRSDRMHTMSFLSDYWNRKLKIDSGKLLSAFRNNEAVRAGVIRVLNEAWPRTETMEAQIGALELVDGRYPDLKVFTILTGLTADRMVELSGFIDGYVEIRGIAESLELATAVRPLTRETFYTALDRFAQPDQRDEISAHLAVFLAKNGKYELLLKILKALKNQPGEHDVQPDALIKKLYIGTKMGPETGIALSVDELAAAFEFLNRNRFSFRSSDFKKDVRLDEFVLRLVKGRQFENKTTKARVRMDVVSHYREDEVQGDQRAQKSYFTEDEMGEILTRFNQRIIASGSSLGREAMRSEDEELPVWFTSAFLVPKRPLPETGVSDIPGVVLLTNEYGRIALEYVPGFWKNIRFLSLYFPKMNNFFCLQTVTNQEEAGKLDTGKIIFDNGDIEPGKTLNIDDRIFHDGVLFMTTYAELMYANYARMDSPLLLAKLYGLIRGLDVLIDTYGKDADFENRAFTHKFEGRNALGEFLLSRKNQRIMVKELTPGLLKEILDVIEEAWADEASKPLVAQLRQAAPEKVIQQLQEAEAKFFARAEKERIQRAVEILDQLKSRNGKNMTGEELQKDFGGDLVLDVVRVAAKRGDYALIRVLMREYRSVYNILVWLSGGLRSVEEAGIRLEVKEMAKTLAYLEQQGEKYFYNEKEYSIEDFLEGNHDPISVSDETMAEVKNEFQSFMRDRIDGNSLGVQNKASAERYQEVIIDINSLGKKKNLLEDVAAFLRSSKNKRITFLTYSSRKDEPIRRAFKKLGVSGDGLSRVRFHINPLRLTDGKPLRTDMLDLNKYLDGIQTDLAAKNKKLRKSETPDIALIAGYEILQHVRLKDPAFIANDKALNGALVHPAALNNAEKQEALYWALFHSAWEILAGGTGNKMSHYLNRSSEGIYLIQALQLGNITRQWVLEHAGQQFLLRAA